MNQRKIENERRKYFMIKRHERMLLELVEIEPATSWVSGNFEFLIEDVFRHCRYLNFRWKVFLQYSP